MGIVFVVLLLLIILMCIGVLGTDGLWHSLLSLFNVLTAAVLATNYWEPTSTWLDSQMPSYSYLIDVLVLWLLFGFFVTLFRLLTQFASRVKVYFNPFADYIGGFILSAVTGWVLVCFTVMSLHTAPLPAHSFGGVFQQEPDSKMFFGLAPDRKWLAFMHRISTTNFAKTPPEDNPQRYVFDSEGGFILTYYGRRAVYETTRDLRVNRDFGSGIVEKGPDVVEQ